MRIKAFAGPVCLRVAWWRQVPAYFISFVQRPAGPRLGPSHFFSIFD